uniref:Uncharacterized protein n=3 Tax=Cacopsylla melanoneura TaxID=428564 RepID=A0A8D8TYU2_9HEMI
MDKAHKEEEEEEDQGQKSQEIGGTDKKKPNIKEEEETESEEESEEDDEDKTPEEKIEEIKLENNITNPTDVIQMETSDVIVEPKPKIKKFVRFALIHNTYHGSDTESEEDEEEEDEEEEEEESEEEEEEAEDGDDGVKAGAVPNNVEESKPVDIVQMPEPDVETVQPIDVEPELETSNKETDNIPTAAPVKDPFENEKVNYENRIRDLLSEKSSHEDRIHNLISDLELKQLEQNQLKGKIGELENHVLTKTWAMDRQEAEMTSAMKESEHLRNKLRRLEDDLTEYRLKNSDLTEELVRKVAEENKRKEETCDFFKIRELEEKLYDANEKIKYLEGELNEIKHNQEIAKEAENIKKADTEVEMKIMREALDEALKQKSILQKRFESEFNQLRNVNTAQEQQLLDDFEWKLREVEQSCKKKILDADKCKRDLEAQVTKLTVEVEELSKFKNAEAELAQLRTVSHEHQRTIRTITRQKEELQVNEKILNEEMSRIKASLEKEKTHIATLQAIHSREITEKNRKHQFKLDQQKIELQEQFEERLKKETLRTKVDCEKHHLEDKRVAVEHTRAQGESKLQEQKKKWEKQLQESQHQVEVLRERVKDSERLHRQEVESAVTHSDQSMLEMRRKFDKLDMSYQEKIEKAQETHEQEIEHLNEEYERRLAQCEASWQQQLSTTRTTLELVKEQMRRDTYDQIQHLRTQHQRELEEQWSRLIQERDEALAELEQRHRTTIESLRTEIEIRSKKSNAESEVSYGVKDALQKVLTNVFNFKS